MDKYDLERKLSDLERHFLSYTKDQSSDLETLRQHLSQQLQLKLDYRDLEQLLKSKVDHEELREILQDYKNDLSSVRKEVQKKSDTKGKKKDEKLYVEEIKANKDKMQKVAVLFDKELGERDKQNKKIQQSCINDAQKAISVVRGGGE